MSEARLYVIGGAVAFAGLSLAVLAGWSWWAAAALAVGLAAVGAGLWTTGRRTLSVRVQIEDAHLRPVPVLDAPKGTYDLIAGLTVRVHNRTGQPLGVRIETRLYHRTRWKWDLPVEGAPRVPLLAPSVVAGRGSKSFFVTNYTRLPQALDELTPDHFVKLLVETSEGDKSVYRAFVDRRFELPKQLPPKPAAPGTEDDHPLLPFGAEAPRPAPRQRPPGPLERLSAALAGLGERVRSLADDTRQETDVVRIDRRKTPDDSLRGLIDELKTELDGDPDDEPEPLGRPTARAGDSGNSR